MTETTSIKNIPYPSEYQNPFFDTFESLMGFLDENVDLSYYPLEGATPGNSARIDFVAALENNIKGGDTLPLRYRVAEYDPWRYGCSDGWFAQAGRTGVNGAPVDDEDTLFQVGSPSMVHIVNIHYAGNYATVGKDALMWDDKGRPLRWSGPTAYLVKMIVYNKVSNSGPGDHVNVVRNLAGNSYGTQNWTPIFLDNQGDGGLVQDHQWTEAKEVDPELYKFSDGDIFDLSVTDNPPSSDAQDLTVELVFVSEGFQDRLCMDGAPQITMTISGMEPEDNWQGLGNGVHNICPFLYIHGYQGTPSDYRRMEDWDGRGAFVGYPGDSLNMGVYYRNDTGQGGTSARSEIVLAFDGYTSTYSSTAGITGYIRDILFTTFVLNGVTFTLDRGPGQWAYEAPPPQQQ